MNAYELADELDALFTKADWEEIPNVVAILRQQADRIAELEKEVKRLVGAEPITHGKLTFCKNCGQQDPYAQTKPLSDEEIKELIVNKVTDYELCRAIEERHGIK